MGSIGQYAGVKDYIYNAHIENVTMLNAEVRPMSSIMDCSSKADIITERSSAQGMGRSKRRLRIHSKCYLQELLQLQRGLAHRSGCLLLQRQRGWYPLPSCVLIKVHRLT